MTDVKRNERGLTLIELTVVFVLATLVMVGLVTFYLNSQSTWMSGSSQAQTQREMTLLLETMADSIRAGSQAIVTDIDPSHQMVTIYSGSPPTARYAFWLSGDSLVHRGNFPTDDGAMLTSHVTRFQLQSFGDTLIALSVLEARTASGDLVRTATSFAPYNR